MRVGYLRNMVSARNTGTSLTDIRDQVMVTFAQVSFIRNASMHAVLAPQRTVAPNRWKPPGLEESLSQQPTTTGQLPQRD